jgi:hypothetical protein
MPASLWALTSFKIGAAMRAKFLVTATSEGSMGSGRGRMRLPPARVAGREGEREGSVPDSRLRLLMVRPTSDGSACKASLRPLRRPEDRCSLSEVSGAGVEGASCLILSTDAFKSAARSGRFSDATEAKDWDRLREARADE